MHPKNTDMYKPISTVLADIRVSTNTIKKIIKKHVILVNILVNVLKLICIFIKYVNLKFYVDR